VDWHLDGTKRGPDMTGADTSPASADSVANEAHDAGEIAAFLAAEAVANDYHSERRADDVVD
jgi:hypothetical protein